MSWDVIMSKCKEKASKNIYGESKLGPLISCSFSRAVRLGVEPTQLWYLDVSKALDHVIHESYEQNGAM